MRIAGFELDDDVLRFITMLLPNVPKFCERSLEIPPSKTYSELDDTVPDCSNADVPTLISYQRSTDPAPPLIACAVHSARALSRGSTEIVACIGRPSSVSMV